MLCFPFTSYLPFGYRTFINISLTRNINSNTQRAADARKHVRDPPHTSKRDSVGRGKPRGRRGGRRQAPTTGHI